MWVVVNVVICDNLLALNALLHDGPTTVTLADT
jgi:hypothetical protein